VAILGSVKLQVLKLGLIQKRSHSVLNIYENVASRRQTGKPTLSGRSQTKCITQQQNIILFASTDKWLMICPTETAWLEKFHIDSDNVFV